MISEVPMLKTYKAVLRGDRIEWIDDPPEGQHPIPVHVTLLEESVALSPSERSRAIADAFGS